MFTQIRSFDDAVAQRLRVCGERNVLTLVRQVWPKARYVADPSDGEVGMRSRSNVLPGMDAGTCDVGVMMLEDLEFEHGEGNHCDKARISGKSELFTIGRGLPVFRGKASALKYRLQLTVNGGVWAGLKERNRPLGGACRAVNSMNMSLSEFAAIVLLSGCTVCLGVLVSAMLGRYGKAVAAVYVNGAASGSSVG